MIDPPAIRPPLALRVGISGLRKLDQGQMDRLQDQVRHVLHLMSQQTRGLAATSPVMDAYRHAASAPPVPALHPALHIISPLARGADRLVAQAGLDLGYTLHVPMPFPQIDYETDFKGAEVPYEPPLTAAQDLAQFHDLLARAGASWFALDGDRGPSMNRAYEAVGRFVVRHCDLLIAIWDGGEGGGRGGTTDIVHYAAHSGVPVWWIHASEARDPAWIADVQDLRDPRAPTDTPDAMLKLYLHDLIVPPRPVDRLPEGLIELLARLGQDAQVSPEAEYFAERPLPKRRIWGAYSSLMHFASGLNPPWTAPRRPADAVAAHWFDLYQPADERAGEYAARYRSSYVWVFFLTTVSLLLGALAVGVGAAGSPAARSLTLTVAGLELAALLLILVLIGATIRRDWHERSIEYRLLAELYRKQQTLASLGWALPVGAARRSAAMDRGKWVAWLFAAQQRAAPLPCGDLTAARRPDRAALLKDLIEEQLNYHRGRGDMAKRAGETFVAWGARSFAVLLLCVVAKLLFTSYGDHEPALFFGLLATALPGVSAAFFGIRAYSELQLLAEQSHHMEEELRQASVRVERLAPARAMVSQDMGTEAVALATLMLQDLEGWARLFRVKGVDLS